MLRKEKKDSEGEKKKGNERKRNEEKGKNSRKGKKKKKELNYLSFFISLFPLPRVLPALVFAARFIGIFYLHLI